MLLLLYMASVRFYLYDNPLPLNHPSNTSQLSHKLYRLSPKYNTRDLTALRWIKNKIHISHIFYDN